MPQRRTEPRTVSLYPGDWEIVDSADIGDAGTSATLRRIVREWSIRVAPKAELHRVLIDLIAPDTPAPVEVE